MPWDDDNDGGLQYHQTKGIEAMEKNAEKAGSVYSAIVAVQTEMGRVGISKERHNKEQGYAFRGIEDVYLSLSPLLAKYSLCILPRIISREVVQRTTARGNALFSVTVHAEFCLVSAEDGSRHTVRTYGEAMDTADKATNKAMSAAYKYMCFMTFCIPTEGVQDDGDADTHTIDPGVDGVEDDPGAERNPAASDPAPDMVFLGLLEGAANTGIKGYKSVWEGASPAQRRSCAKKHEVLKEVAMKNSSPEERKKFGGTG